MHQVLYNHNFLFGLRSVESCVQEHARKNKVMKWK